MRPVICMITDGRLAGGRGAPALVERVRAAARAGVHLIQLRERALDDRALAELTRQCVGVARGTRARIVVNDRLDVALAGGAHGVHLRSDSFGAARVRDVVAPGFLVGRSVHSVDDVQRASDAVDYLIVGTVFASSSKPGREPAGLTQLAEAARVTTRPVLAIGGVTVDNAASIARSGAAGIAAIALFAACPIDSFGAIVEHLTRAFDTPQTGS
jgi:thiamine-phosphate pyrophosphorylase